MKRQKKIKLSYCGKEPLCQCKRRKRCRLDPWVWKIPWRRKWKPAPIFLPGKFHGQRSLVAYSPLGHKESDTTEHTYYETVEAYRYVLSLVKLRSELE